MVIISKREWDDIKEERRRLQDRVTANDHELGGLRTQNVQLHRDNVRLAQHLEMLLVQLAAANDERVALLRARGVNVPDAPQMSLEKPGDAPAPPAQAVWGKPLEDPEVEAAQTLAAVEAGANASLFEDPGDAVAEKLGRRHNDFGEVEHIQGR